MNCHDAQREIALHLGRDGHAEEPWGLVRRHVAACPECRAHYDRLKVTLSVLENSDAGETYESRVSLWPKLRQRLDAPRPAPLRDLIARWAPAASLTAACLLFASAWILIPMSDEHGSHQPAIGRGMAPFFSPPNWREKRDQKAHEELIREGVIAPDAHSEGR